jgi:hypothetical protein
MRLTVKEVDMVRTILITLVSLLWSASGPAQTQAATSTTAYGDCPAPVNAGVRICQPVISPQTSAAIASPFQLIASGTGAQGPVKLMEVWVDYVKVKQAYGNLFDAPLTLSSGTHRLVVVEVDTTGAYLKSAPVTVSIEGDTSSEQCVPPASPGVNVCEPLPNSCHTAPWTTVIAAGTGASGTVHRMELWSSGVKLANFPGNTVNTNLYLPDFSTVTVVEVDSTGAYIKSSRITIQSC